MDWCCMCKATALILLVGALIAGCSGEPPCVPLHPLKVNARDYKPARTWTTYNSHCVSRDPKTFNCLSSITIPQQHYQPERFLVLYQGVQTFLVDGRGEQTQVKQACSVWKEVSKVVYQETKQ